VGVIYVSYVRHTILFTDNNTEAPLLVMSDGLKNTPQEAHGAFTAFTALQ